MTYGFVSYKDLYYLSSNKVKVKFSLTRSKKARKFNVELIGEAIMLEGTISIVYRGKYYGTYSLKKGQKK